MRQMPVLDVTPILGVRQDRERAYVILSFVAHGYVRGGLRDDSMGVRGDASNASLTPTNRSV